MAFQQYPQKLGIPSGNTAGRPTNPALGDTYYNGQLEILEIWNGSQWVAVSAPPATPSIASVTDASTGDAYTSTAGKVTVVFTPGSGGGTPNQYNAFTTAGGFSASSSSSTVTITGLTPGTSYVVYGNGQNNFGTTTNTPNSDSITPTTLPEVRTIGTATASTSANEVTVTWTNGSNGGKNLSAITITPFLNGTTAETSRTAATTSSTSYTFTEGQLTAGSSYTFKVKATNANGTCADSTASNSVTAPNFITVGFLVIAGGGGGGRSGGGGGAGGYRTSTTTSGANSSAESGAFITVGNNVTVTVGGGGAAINADGQFSDPGGNSVFSTITSSGGGGGGSYNSVGGNGGSGGGGGDNNPNNGRAGGSGTANQGLGGGQASLQSARGSGGGGGASAAGGNGSSDAGGNGGNGLANSITGSSVTRGGGGGGSSYSSLGTGGSGGGGQGGNNTGTNPVAGTVNTGGGGGGRNDGQGANGGSGIVILRYSDTRTITVGAGLTAGVTNQSVGTNEKYTTLTAGSGNVSWA